MKIASKTPSESKANITEVVLPNDTNPGRSIHQWKYMFKLGHGKSLPKMKS